MTVIRQLQVKVIIAIIFVQMSVLALMLGVVNYAFRKNEYNKSQNFLETLAKNGGHRPMPPEKNEPYIPIAYFPGRKNKPAPSKQKFNIFSIPEGIDEVQRNYFAVNVSYAGALNEVIKDFPLNYTDEEISNIVISIRETGKYTGIVGDIKFLITPTIYGNDLICMLNIKSGILMLNQFFNYSCLIFLTVDFLTSLIAIAIAFAITKPAQQMIDYQTQFIADVSHELRTPIAVIGANIDVLEGEIGENKWFKYIKDENRRMGELVKDLLYLSKNDSGQDDVVFEEFDFSNAVENAILPFEVVAFESNMSLNIMIQPDIIYCGNEKEIKQVAVILVDNAIKNSESGAAISVSAYTEKDKIFLKVHNTGKGISKDELEKIFHRFYRSDSSRSKKTGGYGLGLSIARTIATKHDGTLTASSELEKYTEFTLALPKKPKKQ